MFENIKFQLEQKAIKGAGGGGPGPQPDAGNVKLKPPSLAGELYQSVAYLSVLDLVSDGPVDGFASPIDGSRAVGTEILSSIFYDDTPLKQPIQRNYAIKDIKGSSIKNVGIFANDVNQPNSFGNIITGLLDEANEELGLNIDPAEATRVTFTFDLENRGDFNLDQYSIRISDSGSGYQDDFSFNANLTQINGFELYNQKVYCYINSFGQVTGISQSSDGTNLEKYTIVNLNNDYSWEWKFQTKDVPEPASVQPDRETAQLEKYRDFLINIQNACPYETKSPFGFIQYSIGDNFDFTAGGTESGIKIYNSSQSYIINTFDTSGNFYNREFIDQLNREIRINPEFVGGAFKIDTVNVEDPPEGKSSFVYPVTGIYGDNFLLFYIGTGNHSGAGGWFNTGKYLTTAGSTSVINDGNDEGYDVFVTGADYIKLATNNVLQKYPFTGDTYDKNIKVAFFTENFENLNFNNISVDYLLGTENQYPLTDYSQGSRDYNINRRLYGVYTGQGDNRGGTEYALWNSAGAVDDYDEFTYTHVVQQKEVQRVVPTIAIQQLYDTVARSGDSGYSSADGGNVGTKTDSELNIRLEYGFEGDRVPLGFASDSAIADDADTNTLVSGAVAQGISPESLVLQSFKQVTDITFNGIINSPYHADATGIGDLPKNTELRNLTYGDVFNSLQLSTLGVNSSDEPFPEESWKDVNRYLKVRKTTQETESVLIKRECSLHSVTEFINAQMNYPFSAAVANTVDARSFSQAPNRTYLMRMKKVLVPSNYYPLRPDGTDKRFLDKEFGVSEEGEYVYYGEWDGTFRFAWTDNPAWILYDLMVNTRYGIGNQIDDFEDVDIFELYTIGRYSDAVDNDGKFVGVKNGKGGLEPRFSCNIAIDQKQNAFQLLGNIAAIFRGMTYWNAGTLNFSIDKPKEVSAIFNNENVFDGMFTYSDVSAQNRFTRVSASYLDRDDDFKMKKEYVDDEEAIRNYGLIIKDMDALGCTSRSQARRMAKYVLLSNKLETESVRFQTDARALVLSPGDIIRIDDELKHFEINYGKVLNKSVEDGWIEIDDQINTGNIALNADSALYLYNDSFDQNDLQSLYDISQFNDNLVLTGESLTLAAINNEDTHNLIAQLGEQYTGFNTWDYTFDSISLFGTSGTNTLFGYKYFGIQDSSSSTRSASLTGFNKPIKNGETYCLSTFVETGSIDPNEDWVFRMQFEKDGELTGQIGMRISGASLSQWVEPANWADNFEIINSGFHETIQMPSIKWNRPYISVKTKTDRVMLSGVELFLNPNTATDTVEFTFPQLELGEVPTPFNSNNFHANNSINKFSITGVDENNSSNGYKLYLNKDTIEYSTFNEVSISSHFNVQLDNNLEELYKIIKISPEENNLYAVEGLQYYSGKFEQIENENFSDYSNPVNVGVPTNTITRPAPVIYPKIEYYTSKDEYGFYYISLDIGAIGLSSAEKYRINMIAQNGTYYSKEVSIEQDGTTTVRFNSIPQGVYTVFVTSIKNPESKVVKPVELKVPKT